MAKSTAPAAPKSQLAAMSGVVVATKAAPVSQLAMFVQGDIKGGEAAHNYRMQVIAAAIREALKGNSRAIIEATGFAVGKSKKARAYFAGFEAIGVPARVVYAGKLDAPENEAARAEILARSASLEFDFEAAFLTAMSAPTEPKAPKAPKAKADDTSDSDAAPAAPATAPAAPAAAPVVADLLVSELVTSTIAAIGGGMVLADELEMLEKAIALHRANVAAQQAINKIAAPATAEA